MGQINDRTYTINDVTYINHVGVPKTKCERIHFKVNKANLADGMLLQLLHDRHLYLGVSYEGEKVKIGDATLWNWRGESKEGTSSYFFDVASIDWLKVKQQTQWDKDKKMLLIVIDKSISPMKNEVSKEEISMGQIDQKDAELLDDDEEDEE